MNFKKSLPTILAIIFLAAMWQVISVVVGYPAIFPTIPGLIAEVFRLFTVEGFLLTVSSTVLRGLLGFVLAMLLAFIMATISAFSPFWKSFFHPIVLITRSIPVISFVLLAILWFSPTELPVFIALLTMFPILYQNILTGLGHTDIKWVEMAHVFGNTAFRRFTSIYMPAAKPGIFDGISTALGFGWRAIIIGEVLAQPLHGIGTAMKHAQAFINVSELIAWTVVTVVVSYMADLIVKLVRNYRPGKILHTKAGKYKLRNEHNHIVTKHIKAVNLNKEFNNSPVINSFDYTFSSDNVYCIKGPSGRGKTTLLRLLAGIEKAGSGKVEYGGQYSMAYAFQDVRLLPWLTVGENIIYGLRKRQTDKNEMAKMLGFLLEKMDLTGHENKYPRELSGGQQQRVSLARALAVKSDILLLDEPLTGLDSKLKSRTIEFLSDWFDTYRPLVIWATHEKVELKNLEINDVVL